MQAVTGLRMLLGVVAVSQHATALGDVVTLAVRAERLHAARAALKTALGNVDLLLDMLKSVGL